VNTKLPHVRAVTASRSDAVKVAVGLQPTGKTQPGECASRQRRLMAGPIPDARTTAHTPFQASLPRRGPGAGPFPWAEAPRLPSFHRYAMIAGRTRLALGFGLLIFGLAAGLLAQQPATEEGRAQFRAVDIYVDAGSTPLAAYQLEFAATNGLARIVGIEGGEHRAFRRPPFYDPKAIQHERVIIASFSTSPATELPVGKTRVATIHYQTTDTQPARFELKLQTVGDARGNRIAAQASFEERKTP